MTKKICPGQDTRFWRPDDIFEINCGDCGKTVEFFKDEATRKCPQCGNRIQNPKLSLGCATWCEHAKECLGFDPKELKSEDQDEESLEERLNESIGQVFGDDQKRIDHAHKVLEHAKALLGENPEASPKVVVSAALLHDIGIKEAEKKHGSAAGVYQEKEGPAIAESIMEELGLDKLTIEHVSEIIANHHSNRGIDTPEFKILWDADWLVNLPDEFPDLDIINLEKKIDKIFKTPAGKLRATDIFLQRKEN